MQRNSPLSSSIALKGALPVKKEIVEKYPWVATNLVKALEASKQLAYKRVANPRMVPLAFGSAGGSSVAAGGA